MKSDVVTKGMQSAPQRSLFNAVGMTKEELSRPLVGIVSSYNESVPGHMLSLIHIFDRHNGCHTVSDVCTGEIGIFFF